MGKKLLYIFEDDDYENFYPLTINRPVFGLLLGCTPIFEKWTSYFGSTETRFLVRGHLAGVLAQKSGFRCNALPEQSDASVVFVNGRYLPDDSLIRLIESTDESRLFLCNGNLVAAVVSADSKTMSNLLKMKFWGYGHFKAIIKDIPKADVQVPEVKHIWDFIRLNPEIIGRDFSKITSNSKGRMVSKSAEIDDACIIHDFENVFIGDDCRIDGQVVIDAQGGPVFISSGVEIQPHTRIEGPCFIGEKSMLVGGKIREGCSIGPVCKVGGEVEESIILGYSNKFHDGFLGHAYLGEWVNLGAMTTNSDLKNNYGTIRVDLGDGQVDTGMTKIGSFIGDHVKTGIGTLLNTGISLGFATNVFGGGLTSDKFVPPFCWGNTGKYSEYKLDKAVSTARAVTARRNVEFTELDERLFRSVFDESSSLRKEFVAEKD